MFRAICLHWEEARKDCDELEIYLIGWSRGAVLAVEVARSLGNGRCSGTKDIPVRWMGLFDAVKQMSFGSDSTAIPDNVEYVHHAIKSLKQLLFPTVNYTGKVSSASFVKWTSDGKLEETDHSEIGRTLNGYTSPRDWVLKGAQDNDLPL